MAQLVVLITFYSRSGATEKLALGAAVGAVQARALIRLRRLPDADESRDLEALARMRKEYVAPAEADIAGADAIILAVPSNLTAQSPELKGYLDLLHRLRDQGTLTGKVAAGLGHSSLFISDLNCFTVTDTSGDPLAFGRAVAEAAKQRKERP